MNKEDLLEIIHNLKNIEKFDLDNYVINQYSVETERVPSKDGEYIESYSLQSIIEKLEHYNNE